MIRHDREEEGKTPAKKTNMYYFITASTLTFNKHLERILKKDDLDAVVNAKWSHLAPRLNYITDGKSVAGIVFETCEIDEDFSQFFQHQQLFNSCWNDDKREKKKIPISRGDHLIQQPEKES